MLSGVVGVGSVSIWSKRCRLDEKIAFVSSERWESFARVIARVSADLRAGPRWELIQLALVDGILDPAGQICRFFVTGAPNSRNFDGEAAGLKKMLEAGRLLEEQGHQDLKDQVLHRATLPYTVPAHSWAPIKLKNRVVYELERVLRPDLLERDRHRLIAEVVSAIVEQRSAEQVRLAIKGAKHRARTADEITAIPKGVIYTVAETHLIKIGRVKQGPVRDLVAQGVLSGARAYFDPWQDAR